MIFSFYTHYFMKAAYTLRDKKLYKNKREHGIINTNKKNSDYTMTVIKDLQKAGEERKEKRRLYFRCRSC